MLDDVRALRELGVAGVVVGCLTADGRIDEPRMTALVEAARPMSVTCHRAFDMTRDIDEADRGAGPLRHRSRADLGPARHRRSTASTILATRWTPRDGRIVIMACGALDETNIAEVLRKSGAPRAPLCGAKILAERHGLPQSRMSAWAAPTIEREFEITVTDPDFVRRTIAAAHQA